MHKDKTTIGIDASNIHRGGGFVYLYELLNNFNPEEFNNVEKIIVWSNAKTLNQLPDKDYIDKRNYPILNKSLLYRLKWQLFDLTKLVKKECDILYVLGGYYFGNFKNFVVIAQNLLPYDNKTLKEDFSLLQRVKFYLIKKAYNHTFIKAKKVIFVSDLIEKIVNLSAKNKIKSSVVINHGVSERFFNKNGQKQKSEKFNLLIVSALSAYKGYYNLLPAIKKLREENKNFILTIVGPNYDNKILKLINKIDPQKEFIDYKGEVPYFEMPQYYFNANGFVFCSKCEAFGLPMLEAAAAKLNIACINSIFLSKHINEIIDIKFNEGNILKEVKLLFNENIKENKHIFNWNNSNKVTFLNLINLE